MEVAEKSLIIVDLDGTLTNSDHRVEFAQRGDWDGFNSLVSGDEAYPDVWSFLMLLWACESPLETWAVSGRDDKYRNETVKWLDDHGVIFDQIFLRPANDQTPDAELKLGLLIEALGGIEEVRKAVLFVLEDNEKTVEMYRNAGLACWQVRPGTY